MKLVIELDEKLAKWLEEKARQEGKELHKLVVEALKKHLEDRDRLEAIERLKSFEGWELNTKVVDREYIYADRD